MDLQSVSRNQIHNQNLKLVLQQIINNPATSRIAISHELALNKSTISSLYNTLMAEHFLEEIGEGAASNVGGRKPMMVQLNREYGYTITFDLGHSYLHASANYIDASVIERQVWSSEKLTINDMLKLCEKFIAGLEIKSVNGLLGICFAIHGIIDNNQIMYSPWIDMQGIDLSERFGAKYGVPVLLENEANLSAVYERDFNAGNQYNSSITVSIHRGIGAGIIVNKKLFRGENGRGGEIGRSLTLLGSGATSQPVEEVCSEDAIIRRLAKVKGLTNLTNQVIGELYAAHDREVERILQQACSVLAGLIYNVTATLDPDVIFINSALVSQIPDLLSEITADYQEIARQPLPILLTDNPQLATLLGGCSLITHHVLGMSDYDLHFTQAVTDL